jgi:endonuclease/exonuclease/phosphatase family metal-dependent hydrolase
MVKILFYHFFVPQIIFRTSLLTKEQIENKIKSDLDLKVKDYEKLNNEQYNRLDEKLNNTNNKIDNKNFPSVADIALAVAGADIFRQIFANTSNPPKLTCQAPTLVPPVSAKVSAVNTAVVGLQTVTIAQSTAIKTAVTQNFNLLSHSQHGLQAIQGFASKAWKATKADKIMNALTTAVVIHNAMMLSSNLTQTISEATNLALDALGIRDESDNLIDIGAAIRGKIDAILSSLLGEANYKALTTRLAAANRVYQASANVYNLIREIGDTTRSITEVACENTGKIGNALLESGAVYENAYEKMLDSVNPQSKAQLKLEKFRNGTEVLENAAEAISSISSDVIELQELRQELTEGKAQLDTARQAYKTLSDTEKAEKKAESQAETDVNKPDFAKDESDNL